MLVPNLKIYSSPRACSTASHIALEESGLDYEYEIVRIRKGEHRSDRFLALNPAGKLPLLEANGQLLTESTAILTLIADLAAPVVRLLPEDAFARYRALEWMGFLTSAVHLSFRPLFRPQQFTDDESLHDAIRKRGGRHLRETLLEVERRLEGSVWAMGDEYSVVDPYLLVFHIWSQRDDIRPHVAEMPNWARHRQAMMQREATARVLGREGITADNITDP